MTSTKRKATAKAGSRKRPQRRDFDFYPEGRHTPRTIRIPEIIFRRLQTQLSQIMRGGLRPAVLREEFIVRILDWVAVQDWRALRAIIARDQDTRLDVPAGGLSACTLDDLHTRDFGPGRGALLVGTDAKLRFGRELYKVTLAGGAPPLDGPPPRFSAAECEYLEALGAEIDGKCGGSTGDDGLRSAPDDDAAEKGS